MSETTTAGLGFDQVNGVAVARYRADGTIRDAVTADFHGKGELSQDTAVADGKLVAGGFTANGVDTEYALMRVNP
jgi:hypothetical protein